MRSPDNKVRKARKDALKLLAAVLIGPALLCGAVWYAQRFTPPADRPSAATDGGTAAPSQPNFIPVNETLPSGHPDAVLNTARQAIPLLARFDDNETALGTGFVYSEGVIVTAAHIVNAAGPDHLTEVVVYCDGRNVAAEVLASDPLRDTAVLAADCRGETLALAHKATRTGQRLYASGYDFGKTEVARYVLPTSSRFDAEISFQPPDTADPRFLTIITEAAAKKVPRIRAIDGQLAAGNSGSLVIDETGAVVGMVVLVDRRQKLTFYEPAVNIRHVLRQAGVE